MTLLYGCEGKTRYQVLSFFFDGVPPPEELKQEGGKEGKKVTAQPQSTYREHGPYAARLCTSCHERGSNKLLVPIEELCLQCHTLNIKKKYIHGPLASGGCKICHSPHGSIYPFLLISEPKDFCLHCHSKKDILMRDVHRETDEQCTVCHDAHSADNAYLLK